MSVWNRVAFVSLSVGAPSEKFDASVEVEDAPGVGGGVRRILIDAIDGTGSRGACLLLTPYDAEQLAEALVIAARRTRH